MTNPTRKTLRGTTTVARHGRLPRRSALPAVFKLLGMGVAVAVVSVTSVGAIAAASLSNSVETVHIGASGSKPQTGAEAFKGAVNFVVVGSDTRKGQSEAAAGDPGSLNNDVTMLIHVSADHQQMTAISIPRDTVASLPPCVNTDSGQTLPATTAMFNTALARGGGTGGLNCVVSAVAMLTGVQADFAGIFKFDGVAAMSSAVGGVSVCIATPIHDNYVGLNLDAGTHTIKGQEASAFLRSRHGVDDGSDLARISNQQVFLSALARKVLSPGGALSNPVTMYKLAQAALSNMIVSDNLKDVNTMVALASTLKGMDLSNILFVQYPTVADPSDPNRLVVSQAAAHTLNVAIQTDAKTNLSASSLGRGATTSSDSGSGTSTSKPTQAAPADGTDDDATTAPTTPSSGAPAQSGSKSPSARSTALPSDITGQSASEATCSKGSG